MQKEKTYTLTFTKTQLRTLIKDELAMLIAMGNKHLQGTEDYVLHQNLYEVMKSYLEEVKKVND